MRFLGHYLAHTRRTDYVAVLYASSSDSAMHRLEAFKGVAEDSVTIRNIRAIGYVSPATPIEAKYPTRTIREAIRQVKETGYRTIVWITPYGTVDWKEVGAAAHEYGLDQGDHFWIVAGGTEVTATSSTGDDDKDDKKDDSRNVSIRTTATAENVTASPTAESETEEDYSNLQFLFNSAYISSWEATEEEPVESPFVKAWKQLDVAFLRQVTHMNPVPIEEYQEQWDRILEAKEKAEALVASNETTQFEEHGEYWAIQTDNEFPPDSFYADPSGYTFPVKGSIYMYDAIMSLAIGACKARTIAKEKAASEGFDFDNAFFSGEQHRQGIRASEFSGASGRVAFGGTGFPGSRVGSDVSYRVTNLFPYGLNG